MPSAVVEEDAVTTALTAADGRDVLVLGANVVDQCLQAGLVDEILMHPGSS
jgi:hypothetical protein